jgi:hypothetical protein
MTAYQRLKRELGEVRLAARIAAGFGLAENAYKLAAKAAEIEARLERESRTEVEMLAKGGLP